MTVKEAPGRMWVVLTFGEDRQHAGNAGYDDVPDKWYSARLPDPHKLLLGSGNQNRFIRLDSPDSYHPLIRVRLLTGPW